MGASGDTPDRRAAAVAGRQHGVLSIGQLLAAGLSRKAVAVRVARGQLLRLHPGVYAVGHPGLAPEGRWMAGVLAGGDGAVLSHQSAAALWGIGPLLVSPVHVIAPTHRRARPGLRPHRSRTLTAGQVTVRRGIPVTDPARTIADLPRHLRDPARIKARVLRLLDAASPAAMPAPGRPVTRSGAERRFLRICRDLGLPEPGVNRTIEGRERDFAWSAERLVVEIDGPHHDDPAQRTVDRARDRELAAAGWRVLRASVDELDAAAYAVLRSISSTR